MATIKVNERGMQEIRSILEANHKIPAHNWTDTMLRALAEEVEDHYMNGLGAYFEILPWYVKLGGRGGEHYLSERGYDVLDDAEREEVMRAISEARKAAEAARGTWDVSVSVDEDDGVERFEVTVTFSAHPSDMEGAACDAPWAEWGGTAIVQALESAGFRQSDAWVGTHEHRTAGGGSVPRYEDGVLMVREIEHD